MAARYPHVILLLATYLACAVPSSGQNSPEGYWHFDSLTLAQYNHSQWKELIGTGKEALQQGNDYYYLRMRMGRAYFEQDNYLQAALHYEQALNFNDADPAALEYLFLCHLELNKLPEAATIFQKMTPHHRDRLASRKPELHSIDISLGYLASDQPEQFDQFDLDGEQNYYGETDLLRDGLDFNTGLSWRWPSGYSVYGGYTHLLLRKNKLASIGDTMAVDDLYDLKQQQFYLNAALPLGKGFTVIPAMNFILDRFATVMPEYLEDSARYAFPVMEYRTTAIIAYISLTKDFRVVQTTLFGAYSNLNKRNQYQAGFQLLAYPLGNLNLYLSSKLMNHRDNGYDHIIFEQMAGVRIFSPLWTEISASFGEMSNYHEDNAYVVYNFADALRFKASGKLIWVPSKKWKVTAEYLLLARVGEFITYQDAGTAEDPKILPITFTEEFYNHLFLVGLNWKF